MPAGLKTLRGLAHHLLRDEPERWVPLLSVYYLTYACEFRCPYCSDGAGNPYYEQRSKVLPAHDVLRLLGRIRQHTENLVITGGEPLKHPGFAEVMAGVGDLGFGHVVLTTNGYGLEPHLAVLNTAVSELVFSLDTLDEAKADAWFGTGEGTLAAVLDTIEKARTWPKRRYDIVISAVVTPDNLDDLYPLSEYAWERGFRLAAYPQLVGVRAHDELHENSEYRRFYDYLIKNKRAGRSVEGTVEALETMRDLRKFACRPFTMLVVSPVGEVYYPCLEIGHRVGNLLETPDLDALRKQGHKDFGPQPECGTQCHSACALGFGLLLASPTTAARELYLQTKAKLRSMAT